MSMIEWAENEVKIACELERGDKLKNEGDYVCTCYESALKAYKAILDDGRAGFYCYMTRRIFDRLSKGLPLTPIEDTEDVWEDIASSCEGDDSYTIYRCKRMSKLFKYVYDDGQVEYRDLGRFCCYNLGSSVGYYSGLVDRIMYETFPVTMPYYPEENHIKVFCEDYLTDPKNGDFDTVGILYVIKPYGERIEINRYFKADHNGSKEISFEEYGERIAMHKAREKKEEGKCI